MLLSNVKKRVEDGPKFCGLLKISELQFFFALEKKKKRPQKLLIIGPKLYTNEETGACSRPLCTYTQITYTQVLAYKKRQKHENFPPKNISFTFFLCNFSVRTLYYFQFFLPLKT